MQPNQKHAGDITGKKGHRRIKRIRAKDQDMVQWKAPTDSDIAVMFAPGRDPAGVGTTIVRRSQKSKVFTITALTKKREKYKYSIYCYRLTNLLKATQSLK